jgi:hypothetical protein
MPHTTGPAATHSFHRRYSPDKVRTMRVVTDGLAVDVTVGHEDHDGRWVTRVDYLIDDGVTRSPDPDGRVWVRDGARFVRLHTGETELPRVPAPHPPLTFGTVHLLSRLANAVERNRRVRFIPDGVENVIVGTLRHIVKPDSDAFLTDEDPRDGRVRITLTSGVDVYLPVPAILTRMADAEFGIED